MPTRASIALVAAVGLFALAGCNQYDQLIAKDQVCDARWADYQAQLQRRADLVPNLVATVKASAQHEEKTLTEVTEARARATGITLSAEDLQDPEKVAAFQKAQDQLKGALSRLLVANEAYPDLKANASSTTSRSSWREPRTASCARASSTTRPCGTTTPSWGRFAARWSSAATGGTFKPRVYFQASADATQAPKVTF